MNPRHVPEKYRQDYERRDFVELHSGWLLASSHVIDSAEYRDYLVEKNTNFTLDVHRQTGDVQRSAWKPGRLLAVDMESYGVLRAVQWLTNYSSRDGGVEKLLGAIIIRGISDLCEEKTESDQTSSNETRQIAVENAAEVATSIIEALNYNELRRR